MAGFPLVETHKDDGNIKFKTVTQKQRAVDKDMAEDHTYTDMYAFGFTCAQTFGPSGPGPAAASLEISQAISAPVLLPRASGFMTFP